MYRLRLVDTLVTHTNIEGFGLTPLSGDRRGYMPPLLKTKQDISTPGILLIAAALTPPQLLPVCTAL